MQAARACICGAGMLLCRHRFEVAGAHSCHEPAKYFKERLKNPDKPLAHAQGRESVPDTVDHVQVRVDPREDRSWLQAEPRVPTDNAHAFDAVGPQHDTPENWSEAVKRLKPRVLQRLLDMHKCARFHPT